MTSGILIWDRKLNQIVTEKVYGDKLIKFLYETPHGQKISDHIMAKKFLSQAYGFYQSSFFSARNVESFIREFEIPMDQYEPGPFRSFNDFFIRRFKKGMRPFVDDPSRLAAFAEGRYLAWRNISDDQMFPVKGHFLKAEDLLGTDKDAKPFIGGPLMIARLCPVDYHRFHFPDDGRVLKSYSVEGALHSVNPLALKYRGDIFATNERFVTILETANFGKIAYIEVGAMMVGLIKQTYNKNSLARPEFKRGDEKGYFLFGASTVIVLGEPGRWSPDADLLSNTEKKTETLVRLGEAISSSRT
jgi:phosphatidylserine decarboxylase